MSDIEVVSTSVKPQAAPIENNQLAQGDKKEVEAKKVSASEVAPQDESAEESDASEIEENQGESESDESSQDESTEDRPRKKSNGFKKRIDKLSKQRTEEAQKRLAAEQERDHWKAEYLKNSGSHDKLKNDEPKTIEASDDKPKAAHFDSHEDYVEALTDWKIEQKEKKKELSAKETEVKSQYQKQMDDHQSRVDSFKKSQPDYVEVLTDFIEEHGDLEFSMGVQESILSSDLGPAVIYELARNKTELDRINSLSAIAAAREIGKIEQRLARANDAQKENQETKKLTKAPAPLSPVGSKGSGYKKSPNEMNTDEYREWRRSQR